MNFILIELCLLTPILTYNDASNMDNFLRKMASYMSLIGFELNTEIKNQINFYQEIKVCCMLRYYIFIVILLNCHSLMPDLNHL